jgi:Alcohol dehydrogenase GroES-like domain
MRAYQLPQGTGIDALVKVDLPVPKPGPRQVLVKVAACSLNFRDLAIALGSYRMPTKPNIVPLSDGAGEVVEIGTGVSRVKIGDRVAGCFFQRWIGGPPAADTHTSALGGSIDGMLREYAVLEEDGVVKLPTHLSFEEGATLPCAAVTAWHALAEHGRIVAGQTVLVQGTGGVSIFAVAPGPTMIRTLGDVGFKDFPDKAWALLIALVLTGVGAAPASVKWLNILEEWLRRWVHTWFLVPDGLERTIGVLGDARYDPPSSQLSLVENPATRERLQENLKAPTGTLRYRWARTAVLMVSLRQMGAGATHPLRKGGVRAVRGGLQGHPDKLPRATAGRRGGAQQSDRQRQRGESPHLGRQPTQARLRLYQLGPPAAGG